MKFIFLRNLLLILHTSKGFLPFPIKLSFRSSIHNYHLADNMKFSLALSERDIEKNILLSSSFNDQHKETHVRDQQLTECQATLRKDLNSIEGVALTKMDAEPTPMNVALKSDKIVKLEMRSFTLEALGRTVDRNVIHYIFPNCFKRPFHIHTYRELLRFLNDPQDARKNDLCGDIAVTAFDSLDETLKISISKRLDFIQKEFPDLKGIIEDFKDPNYYDDHGKVFHNFEELFQDNTNSLKDNDELIDALKICYPLIDSTYFENLPK